MPRDASLHSYPSFRSPRLLHRWVSFSPASGSLSLKHTPVRPASPWPCRNFLPLQGPGLTHCQITAAGHVKGSVLGSWHPGCLRAQQLANVPAHTSAPLRAREWDRSRTCARWCRATASCRSTDGQMHVPYESAPDRASRATQDP